MVVFQAGYGSEIEHLFDRNQSVIQYHYNVFNRKFTDDSSLQWYPKEELHRWLIETLGYEFGAVRFYEQLFLPWNRPPLLDKIADYDDWNQLNPIIPADKRTWFVLPNLIGFNSAEHATLFKLRWF